MSVERRTGSLRLLRATRTIPPTVGRRSSSISGRIVSGQEPRFFVAGFLALFSACLGVGLLACIVLEAFDGDPDLWPLGAEDLSIAAHGQSVTTDRLTGDISAPNLLLCTLVTAGVYLVLRHRARSALATDSHRSSIASSMAEPWTFTVRFTGARPLLFWMREAIAEK